MNDGTDKYSSIINMPYPRSSKHERMSMECRAAQFAPFAALTGHEEAIRETGRYTEKRIEPGVDDNKELSMKWNEILTHIAKRPLVRITYFVPDSRKEGGSYETVSGNLVKFNEFSGTLILSGHQPIHLESIVDIVEFSD